ncbi:MAG: hypothetical protein ACJ8CR_28450 [Roseiflexaceae bacterium]
MHDRLLLALDPPGLLSRARLGHLRRTMGLRQLVAQRGDRLLLAGQSLSLLRSDLVLGLRAKVRAARPGRRRLPEVQLS